ELKVGARHVVLVPRDAAAIREDHGNVPPQLEATVERRVDGDRAGPVVAVADVVLVAEGRDRESVEDTVLGGQPALPPRALTTLAVRPTRPRLIPALREERIEGKRLPPSRCVDVARERIGDDVEEAHVPLGPRRGGARTWLSPRRRHSHEDQARRRT